MSSPTTKDDAKDQTQELIKIIPAQTITAKNIVTHKNIRTNKRFGNDDRVKQDSTIRLWLQNPNSIKMSSTNKDLRHKLQFMENAQIDV
eukprot:12097264-Ditylum_brightwellii.AAC.1